MKFIDEITLDIKAGNGGNGCISFRHDYLNPRAGPDGGNGGRGGNIYFYGSEQINSFFPLAAKKSWTAKNGEDGKGQLKTGSNGNDVYIYVPLGTVIKINSSEKGSWQKKPTGHETEQLILGEIFFSKQKFLIAKGGKGGLGNAALASSVNRAPRYAQKGENGEKLQIKLELKILSDIGLLGFPNSGKSTLINALTNTKVKVANFPFTTLDPQLGVLIQKKRRLTIADLPGIIEGAAKGKGLGTRFLQHVARCSLIVYVLDISKDNLWKELNILEKELQSSSFAKLLDSKGKIIVFNKIDLLSPLNIQKLNKQINEYLKGQKYFLLSALYKTDLEPFIKEVFREAKRSKKNVCTNVPTHKSYNFVTSLDYQIIPLKPHYWKLTGSFIDNLTQKNKTNESETISKKLNKMSLDKYFQEQGIKNNDILIVGDQEFCWKYE